MNFSLNTRHAHSFKKLFHYFSLLGVILCYQNCGPMRSNQDSNESLSTLGTRQDRFLNAKAVLNNYCIGCHSDQGMPNIADFNLANESDFISAGLVIPGDVNSSLIILRSKFSGSAQGNMPANNNPSYTQDEFLKLYFWVEQMNQGSAQPTNNVQQFTCTDPVDISPTVGQSLTKRQYVNSLEDLFGKTIVANVQSSINLLSDESYDHYSHRRLSGLDIGVVEAYHYTALNIANIITGTNAGINSVFGSCASAANPNSTCINGYLNGFAQRIFRRPLTSVEKNDAINFIQNSSSYKEGLNTVLAYHLQSPQFTYRFELGNANDGSLNFDLSPYELATRVSYMATDSLPDQQLMQVAANGTITDINVLKAQTKRLLQTARGKDKIKYVLGSWAGTNQVDNISLLPNQLLTSIKNPGIEQAMISEADLFIDYIVYEQNANFFDLMTSKASFASSTDLASLYKHNPANPNRLPNSATAIMGGRRQGLLLRAPQLTASRSRTSIIHRGVDFQAQIMCNELPSPPGDISAQRDDVVLTPAQLLNTTNRLSIEHQTKSPVCMTCHGTINPTGSAFENFGPTGELRAQEMIFDDMDNFYQNLDVDSKADVPTWGGQTVSVNDAYDLVGHIAQAPEGMACFSKKMFRFLNEKRESQKDECQLDLIYQQVNQSNGNLLDGFVNLIANESNKRKSK